MRLCPCTCHGGCGDWTGLQGVPAQANATDEKSRESEITLIHRDAARSTVADLGLFELSALGGGPFCPLEKTFRAASQPAITYGQTSE